MSANSGRMSRIVARNSAAGLVAQVAIKLLSFAFSIYIIRTLGSESFGQYAAVGAFGALFLFVADLGLGAYTVREVARLRGTDDAEQQIRTILTQVVWLRLLLTVVATVLTLATAFFTGRPSVMIAAIALNAASWFLYAVQGAYGSTLSGFERVDLGYGVQVVQQVIFVGLGIVALQIGGGYFGLILANIVSIAALTFLTVQAVRRIGVRLGRPQPALWEPLLRASLPFATIMLALGLSYNFDTVLLNVTRGDQETGYYTAAYRLIMSFAMISNVFNTSLFPTLTRQAETRPETLPRIYERLTSYLLIISLPITIGTFVLADRLVPFLFDVEYAPAVPALKVLIWVVPLMYLSEYLGYVVVVQGRERLVARSVIISSVVNVTLNLILVPRFGFMAAAVMTVVTEGVLVLQYTILMWGMIRRFNLLAVVGKPLAAAVGMGAVMLLLPELALVILIPLS
ncbi:MAG: flippase, partial [Caldilineaceae bacterium]